MPGAGLKVKVAAISKAAAKKDHQTSAARLVELALEDVAPSPHEILPNIQNLTRNVNRVRERDRPIHLKDLDFILDLFNSPENFIKRDLKINGQRHIILATDQQLKLFPRQKFYFLMQLSRQ